MGLIARALGREYRTTLANPSSELTDALGGSPTASGVRIGGLDGGLYVTTVYQCVDVLARTLASLPLPVYRRLERGKEKAPDHHLYSVLGYEPNPEMTSYDLRSTLQGHLGLTGNAYAEIERDKGDRVTALWPLNPRKMEVTRGPNGALRYLYELPDRVGRDRVVFNPSQILHLRGLSSNGVVGYSPITLAREALGMALATEHYGASLFGNNARPSGVLKMPGPLNPDVRDEMRAAWERTYSGLNNAHRIAILEDGLEFQQIGIAPEDAQFLETRKYTRREIAGIYHVPPHMIGDLEQATFSNIEHQSIDFVVHTMRPWLVVWEQAIRRGLFSVPDRERHFAEFLVDALLRGDTISRYQAYQIAISNGFMTPNEGRELENRNPIEGGDVLLVPLNLTTIDKIGQEDEPAEEAPAADGRGIVPGLSAPWAAGRHAPVRDGRPRRGIAGA
jgi:HK97 family phage portal protein